MTTSNGAAKREAPVTFRARDIEAQLQQRADPGQSPGSVAARDLDRYYAILAAELAATPLTHAERMALHDALNATAFDPRTAPALWMQIEDACAEGLAAKWEIDGPALVARLRGLSLAGALALIDTSERWWIARDRGPVSIGASEA